MRPKRSSLRAVISVVLAAVLLFAAQPGTMAMPASPAPASVQPCHQMMDASMDLAPEKQNQGVPANPCKHMAVCMGLLACYGVAGITLDLPLLPAPSAHSAVHFVAVASTGLTHPPEDPPPIA